MSGDAREIDRAIDEIHERAEGDPTFAIGGVAIIKGAATGKSEAALRGRMVCGGCGAEIASEGFADWLADAGPMCPCEKESGNTPHVPPIEKSDDLTP